MLSLLVKLFAFARLAAHEIMYWVRYVVYTYLIVLHIPDHLRFGIARTLSILAHDKWLLDYRSKYPVRQAPERYKTIPNCEGGQKIDINVPARKCPDWVKYQAELVHQDFVAVVNLKAPLDYNADMVHRIWMNKNEWERDSRPHLFVRFDKLTEDEKEKDRDIVRIILGEVAQYN